jgi:hypothetical protein
LLYLSQYMATYKVIQDIEAEDKLVGPLTLRQFIYAGIAALSGYLGFLSISKHAAFMLAIFLPIMGMTGFFAFPWGKDQPTEIWALAKLRFYVKPRKRIWDQSGTKELVTVNAPKVIERQFTNGLDQDEVRSRLSALASTIDSRGWAIKNVNVNLNTMPTPTNLYSSDRLVAAPAFPQEVSNIDIRASDDMLDASANPIAQQFNTMINAAETAHRQQIMAQLQTPIPVAAPSSTPTATPMVPSYTPAPQQATPTQPPQDYWFLQQPQTVPGQAQFVDAPVVTPGAPVPALAPHAANPTPEEEAMVQHFKEENSSQTVAYGHLKTVKTPQQLAAEAAQAQAAAKAAAAAKPSVTPEDRAAIINLANNDDLDVATIARQAKREVENDGEVVISLR